MARNRKKTLTPQQLMLCRLFLSGETKVDAYLKAGYSDQGSSRKNSVAAYDRFRTESVQRYISDFKGKVDEGVRLELGIDREDDFEDNQLADLDCDTIGAIIDPLDDYEAELLEDTVLTRAGILKRLESIANQAHSQRDYEGQIKPLQEISKIMGFYRPSQVEVSAVNFQLDLAGQSAVDVDADGLDPETVAMAKRVAPTLIGPASQRERHDEDDDEMEDAEEVSVFKNPERYQPDYLDDL
jgi:hypothetical protein